MKDTTKGKLLYLAYYFPPSPEIGAVRAWSTAKYLARLGWEVSVVTPLATLDKDDAANIAVERLCQQTGIQRIGVGRRIQKPQTGVMQRPITWAKYVASRFFERALWHLPGFSWDEMWLVPCLRARHAFRSGNFDLVLATGSPFTSFIAAKRIAERLKVPYVIDYRDPWSLNPFRKDRFVTMTRYIERRVLGDAAAVLTVSPSLAEAQFNSFRLDQSPIVLTNGYDPEQLQDVKPLQFDGCSVVYAGTFYPGKREVDPLLKAILLASEDMPEGARPISLHYFGPATAMVRAKADALGLANRVICHGSVPREEAWSAIRGADVAVVIANTGNGDSLMDRGTVTGKLFEVIGLGAKLLLIAPDNSDAVAIIRNAATGRSYNSSQVAEMAEWLKLVSMAAKGAYVTPHIAYSWGYLSRQMSELLSRLVRQSHTT